MNYDQVKNLYDTIDLALNTATGWHTDQAMPRAERQLLFDVEDRLSQSANALFDLMERRYKDEKAYRRWLLTEGWDVARTPEEEAFVGGQLS